MAADIITTRSEHRHIAKRIEFDATLAPHINWESIATYAKDVGGHFEAQFGDKGSCVITVWWPLTAEDYAALMAERAGKK